MQTAALFWAHPSSLIVNTTAPCCAFNPRCKGDGVADDAPALQRAVDAALDQGRTLLLPAGVYLVNATINVRSSARMGYAVPGPGFAKHPLRLVGEGPYLSSIVAAAPLHAVLNFSSSNSPSSGAAAPTPSDYQFVSDVCVDAARLANFSIFAPGLARSRFLRVRVKSARTVGLSIGYVTKSEKVKKSCKINLAWGSLDFVSLSARTYAFAEFTATHRVLDGCRQVRLVQLRRGVPLHQQRHRPPRVQLGQQHRRR